MGTLGANRLTIACSNCGATLAVPATAAGRRIRCPKCDHRFVAQTPGPAPAETGTMSTGDARSNRVTVLCECGKRLKLPWAHAGKAARCPACRHALRVAGRAGSSLDVVATGRLVVRQAGQRDGEQVFLAGSGPVTVGKAPDNGLALPGTRLSRHHCSLTPFEGGWRIGDRGSTNGLFVNAKRVSSHDLEDGDQIQIGEFELTYRTVGSAAPGALAAAKSGVRQSETPDDATYRVADDFADLEALTTGERVAPVSVPGGTGPAYGALEGGSAEPGGGPTCPCCKRALPASGQVCVACGINVKTGRSILTAEDTNVDETYVVAEGVIGWLSWILWTGVYPIASEAFGTRKPHVIRGVAVITILTSLVFLAYEWTGSPKMGSMKNLMLWAGDRGRAGQRSRRNPLVHRRPPLPLPDPGSADRQHPVHGASGESEVSGPVEHRDIAAVRNTVRALFSSKFRVLRTGALVPEGYTRLAQRLQRWVDGAPRSPASRRDARTASRAVRAVERHPQRPGRPLQTPVERPQKRPRQHRRRQQVRIHPAQPGAVQSIPLHELKNLGVVRRFRRRQLPKQGNDLDAVPQIPTGQLADHKRMAQHVIVQEQSLQPRDALAEMVHPDRRVDQDHPRCPDRLLRIGASDVSVPPSSASRRALSRATSASRPARTSDVFSWIPVSLAARLRSASSMFSVVLIHINMYD